jgi:hypothetical protein
MRRRMDGGQPQTESAFEPPTEALASEDLVCTTDGRPLRPAREGRGTVTHHGRTRYPSAGIRVLEPRDLSGPSPD